MPSVLKHNPCPACGHRHHFCLPEGDAPAQEEYAYVCPETGQPATLRPEVTAEAVHFAPLGAVQLMLAERAGR